MKDRLSETAALREENLKLKSQIRKVGNNFQEVPELRAFLGRVKSINENSLVIQQDNLKKDALDNVPVIKTVVVTSNTKIIKFEKKTDEELQEETRKYEELVKNNEGSYTRPPGPFKEVTITLGDIKINDLVVVDAGKDIKDLESFEAVKIMLQNQ